MYTYTLFAHAVLRILERHKNCIKADKAYSFFINRYASFRKECNDIRIRKFIAYKSNGITVYKFVCGSCVVCYPAFRADFFTSKATFKCLKGSPIVACKFTFRNTIAQEATQSVV